MKIRIKSDIKIDFDYEVIEKVWNEPQKNKGQLL